MAVRDPNIRDYKLSKTLDFVIDSRMRENLNTMIPGRVESYDPATKRARIQPLIYRVLFDPSSRSKEKLEARAMLLDVPVIAPSTGGVMVHHPLKRGDVVMVLFSERGLDEFKSTWDLSEPTDGKFFDDPVAVRWGVETIRPVDDDAICIQSADGNTYIKLRDGLIELKCGSKTFRMTPTRGDFI